MKHIRLYEAFSEGTNYLYKILLSSKSGGTGEIFNVVADSTSKKKAEKMLQDLIKTPEYFAKSHLILLFLRIVWKYFF